MKPLNRTTAAVSAPNPERILQFGGGNFLRAFVDWMLDVYNEKMNKDLGVVLVTPIDRDNYTQWQQQEGLYHVLTRGLSNGEVVDESYLVKSISRIIHLYPEWENFLRTAENPDIQFVISNTTEAGIRFSDQDQSTDTPPKEFPAKLTLWLHRRFIHLNGDPDAGCIFIPVELILKNGENLRKCILQYADLWTLGAEFKKWISDHNTFCNTLVDRIVPGISRESLPQEMEKLGFEDQMMTEGEAFHFWVIEGPAHVRSKLPLDQAGLNVVFTEDLTPYRTRKVRILNGAHTSMVPVGYLYGIETVRETVEHPVMGSFVQNVIFNEIVPSIDSESAELKQYAEDVLDRFRNPFIKHQLISIALNSSSKVKSRILPSILAYQEKFDKLPNLLVFSMAAFLHFYKGSREGQDIPLKDDPAAIQLIQGLWSDYENQEIDFQDFAAKILEREDLWGQNLTEIEGFKELLADYLASIESNGMQDAVKQILN